MSKLKTISKLDGLDGRLEGATRPRQIIWQAFGLHISCNVPDRPLRGCRSMQPRSTKANSEHPAFSIDNAPAPWSSVFAWLHSSVARGPCRRRLPGSLLLY